MAKANTTVWIIGGGIAALALVALAAGTSSRIPDGWKGHLRKPPVEPRRVPEAYPPLGPGNPHIVTSTFGPRINPKTGQGTEYHGGVDVAAPIGTPVLAPLQGTVCAVWSEADGNPGGNGVCIRAAGYRWWFFHLSQALVEKGQRVGRGQTIGLSGSTGRSTGPHLHITIEDETADGRRTNAIGVYPEGTFHRNGVAVSGLTGAGVTIGDVMPYYEDEEQNTEEAQVERWLQAQTAAVMHTYNLGESAARRLVDAADAVGGSGIHLAKVIWAESRMKTKARNPVTGATGLIQFMPKTAKALGTSTEALARMSFERQLDYVQEYLERVASGSWAGGEPGLLDTQFKMAAAVFYPAWRDRDPSTVLPGAVQRANPGIRTMGQYLDFVLAARSPLARTMEAQAAGPVVGAITGDKNPCNLYIEAHRVDNDLRNPDRDLLVTYRDLQDSGIMAECAAKLRDRAKRLGRSPGDEASRLRAGMKGWYERTAVASDSYRGAVSFGRA